MRTLLLTPIFWDHHFLFLLMIYWTVRHFQYKTTNATILLVVADIVLPMSIQTTPPPVHQKTNIPLKKYQITYTENQKTYTIVIEDHKEHKIGDEINIRIKRADPTKYSLEDDTSLFYFMWLFMLIILMIARSFYKTLNTLDGSRL